MDSFVGTETLMLEPVLQGLQIYQVSTQLIQILKVVSSLLSLYFFHLS